MQGGRGEVLLHGLSGQRAWAGRAYKADVDALKPCTPPPPGSSGYALRMDCDEAGRSSALDPVRCLKACEPNPGFHDARPEAQVG